MSRSNKPSVFTRRKRDAREEESFPRRRFAEVLGARMAYIEEGTGPPVVFLHGGIGSAVLWRRQIDHLSPHARCIAVDLIGTGDSDRLAPHSRDAYRLEAQLAYFESFIEVLDIHQPLTLVLHGWASMVGFAFASRHDARIRGVCHMESIAHPLEWDDIREPFRGMLERVRSAEGERFVMDTDDYFELAVRRESMDPLGRSLIEEYHRTLGGFAEMRQALRTGLSQIPIGGQPPAAHQIVQDYARWLRATDIPKLLVLGEPGYFMVGRLATSAQGLPNQTVVRVTGAHLLPEDSPDGVGLLLAQWFRTI